MSSIYDPYRADVEEQHRYSIRHKLSAVAHPRYGDPFELDVTNCTIDFDMWSRPYIKGDVTAKVIEDQEILDSLDPRNGCRVRLYVGYTYDGFEDDSHLMADLHLRVRTVDRPSNTMKLTLGSDEELAQDAGRLAWMPQAPLTGINEFVKFHADRAMIPTPAVIVSDFPAGYGAAELADMSQDVGQDSLSMILDAAERLNLSIHCQGDRTWRIRKHAEIAGATALKLFVGSSGTILSSSTALTRGETQGTGFHNAVALTYKWRDSGGVDRVIYGSASVATGPLTAGQIGYNTYREERNFAIGSTALANNAAKYTLGLIVGRGHQVLVEAHAAYWLRPGMTVTVQLPVGDQQRYLVRQVQFNPVNGTMDLALFQPLNVSITTSG